GRTPDRERLFAEFASGLAEELDFLHEADVAEEIAANLAGEPLVVVPRVHRALSSRRVLTVDWRPVIPIGDRAALEARGVPLRDVVAVLGRAYAKQVFVDGLFHADPDRKSTRLNSSHVKISYAVFCLKKKSLTT